MPLVGCTILRQPIQLKLIGKLLFLYSKKFNVRVYQNSVNSNHLHLILFSMKKTNTQNFLRVFAGQVAQQITHSIKGQKLKLSFWIKIAWSRIVEWGRAFNTLIKYVFQNQMESLGLVTYRERRHRLSKKY